MKTLIIIIFVLAALITELIYSQSSSSITFDAGTVIDVGTGTDICADQILINGTYSGGGSICGGALPVTISSFTYSAAKNNVILKWVTEMEMNNRGFDVERKQVATGLNYDWKQISFVGGNGNSSGPITYTYNDKNLQAGSFKYRLKQIDYNGNYEYYELESAVTITAPKDFSISQNYPNPSNPKSKIDYEIPISGKVSVIVYDMLGKESAVLVNEFKKEGYYTVEFNGSDVASGVYFYRIIAQNGSGKYSQTMKMVLVK